MDAKEIKSVINNLEKANDDATILKLLNILKTEVVPTEKLLRVSTNTSSPYTTSQY